MADNTELNSGSGGDTIATDDIGGVKHQRVKVEYGADGSATDVSAANPLPVYLAAGNSLTQTMIVTNTVNTEVVGDVSLTGSMSVFVTNTVNTEVVGDVSLTGSMSVFISGGVASLSSSYSVAITNMHTADFDTGGGTDTTPAFGIAVPASGGAAVVPGDATAGLKVDLGADNDVTVTGVVSLTGSTSVVITSGTVTANAGSGTFTVGGVAAHDAAVSGNPILSGLEARTTNPTAVGDGDVVRAMADDVGRQVVVASGSRDLVVDNHVSLSVSTTVTLLAAGGAGVFRDLLALTVSNPAASAATVTIYDGLAAGTQKFKWEFAADGGGVVLVFNTPFKQGTANNGWAITSTETGVTATIQAVDNV